MKPRASPPEWHQPARFIGVALVFTFLGLGWLGWENFSEFQSVEDRPRTVAIQSARGEILLMDEVLTMSAKMASATGEALWEERYRRSEPLLENAIDQIRRLSQDREVSKALGQSEAANLVLVNLENRSFDLVRRGDRAGARAILGSDRYRSQKAIYEQGMRALSDRLRQLARRSLASERRRMMEKSALSVAIIAWISAAWFLALRTTRLWRHAATLAVADREGAARSLASSEAHLSTVLRTCADALFVIDERGQIRSFNATAERIFGRRSEEVVGENVRILMPEPYRSAHEGTLDGDLETGRREIIGMAREIAGLRSDGTQFPLDLSVSEFTVEGERFYSGIARDITARKQAEAALLDAQRAAETSAKAKGEFLANMSHEIRTPLNGTLGMAELLLESELSDEQREYAETIQSSGNALLGIINDILDYSKLDGGRVEIETIEFDLRQTIDDIGRLVAPSAREKEIELISMIRYDVPVALRGDPGRLRQILVNLLGNAIKFTSQGEALLEVGVEASDPRASTLHFRVSDTGIGIPPDKLEGLFSPFTQADASITRRFGGTGLGLSIARRLAILMGGSLSAESTEGEGATFHLRLPFERQHAEAQSVSRPRADLSGLRVLIADGHPTYQRVLRHYCDAWKLEIESAETSDRALELLRVAAQRGRPHDLVILDSRLTPVNGFALAHEIHRNPGLAGVRQVLLSSSAALGEGRLAREAGASAYLVKPIRRSQLFDCLATVMGRPLASTAESAPFVTRFSLEKEAGLKRRILVVEDSQVNSKLAVHLLEKMGFQTDVAKNGREAVDAVERGGYGYDLILMDCQMPVLDGFEATRLIREKEAQSDRHIPIVALTANALAGDRERCLDTGMDGYLAKPFRRADLESALARWLAPAGTDESEPDPADPPV